MNRKMIGKLIKKYKEIIMYLIFGVLTTLVELVLLCISDEEWNGNEYK